MNYDISLQYISYINISDISNMRNIMNIPNHWNSFRDILMNNTNTNEIIRNSFQEKPVYKKIITKNAYNKLQQIKFNSNNTNLKNNKCPIYYLDFEENEEITILPCNHCFNSEAIKKWLFEENNECPVCRTELEYEEVRIENKDEPILENNEPILENNEPNHHILPHNNFYPILEM